MHPIFLRIGGLTINWFGVMMALGFLSGLAVWHFLGRDKKKDFAYSSDLLFWMMISGILGARLAYVVSEYKDFIEDPLAIVRVDQGGLIYYGGFIGALIALAILAKLRKESFLGLLDFVATALPLAHAFGRVGCFMNGCCFGKLYRGALSVRFPHGSNAWARHWQKGLLSDTTYHGNSLPVYPVQLYESGLNVLLFLLLLWVWRRREQEGFVAAVYLLAYPLVRICMETMRGDERMLFLGVTVAQAVSIALFAAGLALLRISKKLANAQV